jgi:pyridoxamine 5'-phosphate oxidase
MSINYNIRKEYGLRSLDRIDLHENPFNQFAIWYNETLQSEIEEPNAMVLSTVDQNNRPSSRIVLLKDCTRRGFTFFTNYNSKKSIQLTENPYASLLFPWHQIEWQVRVEGKVERLENAESDAYYNSRPEGSRLAAWASSQSSEIDSREPLETRYEELTGKYKDQQIPRPEHWGGFVLLPDLFEFWQGRENRLHDRFEYILKNDAWEIRRLAP